MLGLRLPGLYAKRLMLRIGEIDEQVIMHWLLRSKQRHEHEHVESQRQELAFLLLIDLCIVATSPPSSEGTIS